MKMIGDIMFIVFIIVIIWGAIDGANHSNFS